MNARRLGALVLAVITIAVAGAALYEASSSDAPRASTPDTTVPVATGSTEAVQIKSFAFAPPSTTVKVGQTITWTNADAFAHSIKSADGSFDSPDLAQNATYSASFATAGQFPYICGIHNSMTGTVVVEN
jgi:plastocyanin